MRNLLEFLLLHLVQHPDAIEVEEIEQEDFTEFILHVDPEDMGRVIGRQGKTIQAIRTIAKVRAIQDNIRVRINLAEENETESVELTESVESAEQE